MDVGFVAELPAAGLPAVRVYTPPAPPAARPLVTAAADPRTTAWSRASRSR